MNAEIARPLDLVLIESNPAEAYLTVEGLKAAGLKQDVTVFNDSLQAIEQLQAGRPADLIFLDLGVTPVSGMEVLEKIRSDSRLRAVPVVILSGSQNAGDIRKCYESGANCFIGKSSRLDQFMRLMKTAYEFWATVVTLPSKQ